MGSDPTFAPDSGRFSSQFAPISWPRQAEAASTVRNPAERPWRSGARVSNLAWASGSGRHQI